MMWPPPVDHIWVVCRDLHGFLHYVQEGNLHGGTGRRDAGCKGSEGMR